MSGQENVEYPFAKFKITSGAEVVEDDYLPKKELFHTFRPDVPDVDALIPNVFMGLTLSPWLVLLGLVREIMFNPSGSTSA